MWDMFDRIIVNFLFLYWVIRLLGWDDVVLMMVVMCCR